MALRDTVSTIMQHFVAQTVNPNVPIEAGLRLGQARKAPFNLTEINPQTSRELLGGIEGENFVLYVAE